MHAVDSRETPTPLLLMPYFELGSLEGLQKKKILTRAETSQILYQVLQALDYLHARQDDRRRIAHRDIKPANLLVVSQSPLHIKLADFGLAQDRSELETLCGTFMYTAPELFSDDGYTVAVDIWSIAVVVLEYAFGLPAVATDAAGQSRRGHSWCQQVVNEAKRGPSHPLHTFLFAHMLKMKPSQRLSARQCLEQGAALGLFDHSDLEDGSATPRQLAAPAHLSSASDGSTTILAKALWYAPTTTSSGSHLPTQVLRPLTVQAGSGSDRKLRGEVGSAARHPGVDKRQRSPAGNPAHTSSEKSGKKCRLATCGERWSSLRSRGPLCCPEKMTTSIEFTAAYIGVVGLLKELQSRGKMNWASDGENGDEKKGDRERSSSGDDNRDDNGDSSQNERKGNNDESDQNSGASNGIDDSSASKHDHKKDGNDVRVNNPRSTRTLVERLCAQLARLGVSRLRLTQDADDNRIVVTAFRDRQKFNLASPTSSEQRTSTTELATHLAHHAAETHLPPTSAAKAVNEPDPAALSLRATQPGVQVENGDRQPSITAEPAATVRPPCSTDRAIQGGSGKSGAQTSLSSGQTESNPRQYGTTFPSALLDAANVSV